MSPTLALILRFEFALLCFLGDYDIFNTHILRIVYRRFYVGVTQCDPKEPGVSTILCSGYTFIIYLFSPRRAVFYSATVYAELKLVKV